MRTESTSLPCPLLSLSSLYFSPPFPLPHLLRKADGCSQLMEEMQPDKLQRLSYTREIELVTCGEVILEFALVMKMGSIKRK